MGCVCTKKDEEVYIVDSLIDEEHKNDSSLSRQMRLKQSYEDMSYVQNGKTDTKTSRKSKY